MNKKEKQAFVKAVISSTVSDNIPDWIKNSSLCCYGDEVIKVIPVDYLLLCQPMCNKGFKKEHVEFLKSKGINEVYASVFTILEWPKDYEQEQNKGKIIISAMIINLNGDDAEKFSKKSRDRMRPDACGKEGWSYFESE